MFDTATTAGVCSSLIFVVLNVAMNLYMKWLFAPQGGDFAFPWTMLAVQQLQAYMVLQPWIAIKFPAKRCGWDIGDGDDGLGFTASLQVLAVTGLFCLNVGLNSLSLVRISITLNQTVRAFLPVGVLLLASLLERRTYPKHSYVTTTILIFGIALTCWGSPDFEPCGFCLALASTMIAAVGSSLNGRLLNAGPFSKAGPEKIARLMMLQSVPAFCIFSVIATLTEGHRLRTVLQGLSLWEVQQRLGLISISSALALMSNLGRCFLVAATSALMETLAGNAKVAALCIIDHQIFHTSLFAYNYMGIALTFTGFSVHLLLQYASSRPEVAPEPSSGGESGEQSSALPIIPEMKASFHSFSSTIPMKLHELNLPRVVSGGETGLASEHLALRLGKPLTRRRRRWQVEEETCSDTAAAGQRRRASTWQAGTDPTKTWLERVVETKIGVALAPVLEAPPWLGNEEGQEPAGRAWAAPAETDGSTPRSLCRGKEERYDPLVLPPLTPPERQSSRSRIWSDMTHSVSNPRPI